VLDRVSAAAELVLRDASVPADVRARRADALLRLSNAFACATWAPGEEEEDGVEQLVASAEASLEEMFLTAGEARRAG
jgi:hypothetical protein